jgi:hypothetical protein
MKHSSKSRKNPRKRPLGLYRGKIWIAPDFDAPLMLVEDPEAKALTPDKSVAKKRKKKKAQSSR